MTACGDLFRYVPQIEEMGLDLPAGVITRLADRDRQLEDYLSELECGGGTDIVRPQGTFNFGKNATIPAGVFSPANGWTLNAGYGEGATLVAPSGSVSLGSGVWAIGATLLTQGQAPDYKLGLFRFHNGDGMLSHEAIVRSTNVFQGFGYHLSGHYVCEPQALPAGGYIDFRWFHDFPDFDLGGTIEMHVTLLGPVP